MVRSLYFKKTYADFMLSWEWVAAVLPKSAKIYLQKGWNFFFPTYLQVVKSEYVYITYLKLNQRVAQDGVLEVTKPCIDRKTHLAGIK